MECTIRPAVLGDCPAITRLNREAGLKTDCQGVLFSLPVAAIMGLQALLKK